jgi:hypothetical protein
MMATNAKRFESQDMLQEATMLKGKSITELAVELERQAKSRKDFIAPSDKIRLEVDNDNKPLLHGLNGGGGYELTELAHQQLAEIPALQQPDERRRRVLQPLDHILAVAQAPVADGAVAPPPRVHICPPSRLQRGRAFVLTRARR